MPETAALATDQPDANETRRLRARTLTVACSAHALHDGFADLLYVLLPVWQSQFGLAYSVVGLLRAAYSVTMAGLQIPSSLVAERFGKRAVLGLGTLLAGAGFIFAGISGTLIGLCIGLIISGVGSSTQHPLASALVANAYAGTESRAALATYNFSGDIGKMLLPAAAGLLLIVCSWQSSLLVFGCAGLVAAVAILLALRPPPDLPRSSSARTAGAVQSAQGTDWRGFSALFSLGIIDSATRMSFLTFLPFVLGAKGASLTTVGFGLTLVFLGGAAGKLVCGRLGAHIGVVRTVWLTELLTTGGIIVILLLPLGAALAALVLVGIALNGTSSVLYGTVPELVADAQRGKAFGIFYTGTIGAGAIAPILCGWLGDVTGIEGAMLAVALFVLLTLPLAWLVNQRLEFPRK